jgi:hypothetical protein
MPLLPLLLYTGNQDNFNKKRMSNFKLQADLRFNRGMIENPKEYLTDSGCVSWLFLIGEEFASMPGGISFEQVRDATKDSLNVISDPPRELTFELAKQQIAALDQLPRPTLISCRTGPRASALAYLYSGLQQGADPEEVIEAAENDDAPFVKTEEYKNWVRFTMQKLKEDQEAE